MNNDVKLPKKLTHRDVVVLQVEGEGKAETGVVVAGELGQHQVAYKRAAMYTATRILGSKITSLATTTIFKTLANNEFLIYSWAVGHCNPLLVHVCLFQKSLALCITQYKLMADYACCWLNQ
jgi:hypothetical protein